MKQLGTPRALHARMAQPRRILPGTTYMLTRRCYQRTFRLRPSGATNAILRYALAWAAQKTGVEIHAACVMSNHHHLVLTDVRGVLPDFAREFHRTTAKALNAVQGQWENLWASDACHSLELAAVDDVIDKVAYVAANPTEAGLVERPEDWPGVLLLPKAEEQEIVVRRPDKYFADQEVFPEALTLRIRPVAPKAAPEVSVAERVAAAIRGALLRARESILSTGRTFLGRAAVMGQSFQKRAESFEPRRGPIPVVRARNRTLLKALLRTYRGFHAAYREAFADWRHGDRAAVFPVGTWAMRVVHAAAVATLR